MTPNQRNKLIAFAITVLTALSALLAGFTSAATAPASAPPSGVGVSDTDDTDKPATPEAS